MSIWSKIVGGLADKARNYVRMKMMGNAYIFTSFGNDAYASDIVRSTVHAIASGAAKFKPKHIRRVGGRITMPGSDIERLLVLRPNPRDSAYDFNYKMVTQLFMKNNAFALIQWDGPNVIGFIPIVYMSVEALEYEGELYLRFNLPSGNPLVAPYEDVIHLRRFYYESDLFGEGNDIALLPTLELIHTSNEGISAAVKTSADLKGLLKYTANMRPEDLKASRDSFVKDYLDMSNNGGVAALDTKADYIPIKSEPKMVNAAQQRYIEEKVYKYFNVNEAIVMSKYTEDEWNAFYESVLEPIAVQFGLEFTYKLFTRNERAHGNEIVYEANRLQYASVTTKLDLLQMVDRGAMTPNEWREVMNYAPIDGGDKPVRRLDTAEVNPREKKPKPDKQPQKGDEEDDDTSDDASD